MNHTVCLLAWRECGMTASCNHWWSEVNPAAFSDETMLRALDLAIQSMAENESRNQGCEGKFTYWVFTSAEDFLALASHPEAKTKPGIFLGPSLLKTTRHGGLRLFFDGVCDWYFKRAGATWPIPVEFLGESATPAPEKTSSRV